MSDIRARRFDRRLLMRGAALGAAVPVVPAVARATATGAGATRAATRTRAATFRWFGTSGWRIDTGGRTILFDPYLTRFPTGLFTGGFHPDTALTTDQRVVRRHIGDPELILVSHSHWDHLNDVPYIAEAAPGARIVATETTYHLLQAFGVDKSRISVVKGGEVLDFDGLVVEVVSSRHSRNASYGYFAPGTLHGRPPTGKPRTISDLPEGDTLAFQLTPDGGPSAFLMGASDFSERDASGLRPDVAMVATASTAATHAYVPRLMKTLGHPATVVPVHWDNFELPLDKGAQRDPNVDLDAFVRRVEAASPGTRVLVPEYLTPYRF
ncbi:MBL fold metallo-hydrolase [Streptomyces sp. NPDC048636]|uniref:MBL fold metallo-hydrolase n=1 Tax=Streptomyces sp. NPDC048636 TaxID=3155762 RepID=UPI0034359D78